MAYHIISPEEGTWESFLYKEKNIKVCRMVICGSEFDSCIKIAENFDSKTWKESEYRKGHLNNKAGAVFNTEEVGALSEYAVCKLFGLVFDGNNKKGGFAEYDFKISGYTYNVKGASSFRGKNYIKAVHETGVPCELKSQYYFLSYINSNLTNRENKIAIVDIVGLISRESIQKIEPKPSPTTSEHQNYEVTYDNPEIYAIDVVYNVFSKRQKEKDITQQIDDLDFKLIPLSQ